MSTIIPCDLPAAAFAPLLPALPAVAVAEAVAALGQGQLSPGIKWVNDVLLSERKVAGVLTALRTHRGQITAVVLGVGLNVTEVPEVPVDVAAVKPTSLRAALPQRVPTLEMVLEAVLAALARRLSTW